MTFKQLMKKYGLTDHDVAVLFGIPERTVRSWRLGERQPIDYVFRMIEFILRHFDGGITNGSKKKEKGYTD